MKTYLVAYVATLVAFTGIDFVWLGKMADIVYKPAMGDMVLDRFRLAPAAVFYLLYAFGLVFLAVRPALASGDWSTALVNGAVVGFMAYGTYDLTNQATLKSWSTTLTIVDMSWGTILSAAAATVGFFAASWIARG